MSKPAGISCNLIAKNCAESLDRCLTSLRDFLRFDLGDEIVVVDTGSGEWDKTITVAQQHGAKVIVRPDLCNSHLLDLVRKHLPDQADKLEKDPQFEGGFLSDFAKARQIAADASANDLIFWIDSDDVLTGGKQLREFCTTYFQNPKDDALFLRYDYCFDPDGNCNTVLWRERILSRKHFHWAGKCHESMIPNDGTPRNIKRLEAPEVAIVHKNERHHNFSDLRNYVILLDCYENEDWKDPRTEFYLGNACRGLMRFNEAIEWYKKVLLRSGSRDDRLSAALNIAYCHLFFGRPWKAIDWFFMCTKIQPQEPRAYFGIARAYHELGRHTDCLLYTQIARALPRPQHITAVDPNHFDFYPTIFAALSLKKLGRINEALDEAKRAVSLRPEMPEARALAQELVAWAQTETTKAAVVSVANLAFSADASREILQRLRPEVRRAIPDLDVEKTATRPDKSITFLCPTTLEPWDPTSEDSGVGGSEKMVIQLARRLAARGFKVDVYGTPRDDNKYKVFDKVCYRPFSSYNPKLPRDIVVVWRSPEMLDFPILANRIYLDMHDVANPAAFTPDRLRKLTGVLWKSKYHRDTAGPACPEDKCIYTRNGIDTSHFAETIERNYNKVVWCSSGDRGLLGALEILRRAKARNPEIEPHIFYGFTPLYFKRAADIEYQHFGDLNHDCHMLDYAERCFEIIDKIGAKFHGRVGHKELAAHLQSAGIWLYPTGFSEISCMSAMEAQAAGAYPLCSGTGALSETVKWGTIIEPREHDKYINAIHAIVNKGKDLDDYRANMIAESRKSFDLDSLADEWAAIFTAAEVRA